MSPAISTALALGSQRAGLFQSVFPTLMPTDAANLRPQMGPAAPAPVKPTRENTQGRMTGSAIAAAKAAEKLAAHLKTHPPKTEKPYVRPTRENTPSEHTGSEIAAAYRAAGLKMPEGKTTLTTDPNNKALFATSKNGPDLTNAPLPAPLAGGVVGRVGTPGFANMFTPPLPSPAQQLNPKMTALPQTSVMLNTLFPTANPLLR